MTKTVEDIAEEYDVSSGKVYDLFMFEKRKIAQQYHGSFKGFILASFFELPKYRAEAIDIVDRHYRLEKYKSNQH
ncbi:MAG: hypothetical protein WC758_05530 [Candidatus Woesearchaeota archaeon]|jgi:hypothetical protein